MIKMKPPEGGSSCSFGGESFDAGADGTVSVPAEAVVSLMDHGFTVVPQQASDEAAANAAAEAAAKANKKGGK